MNQRNKLFYKKEVRIWQISVIIQENCQKLILVKYSCMIKKSSFSIKICFKEILILYPEYTKHQLLTIKVIINKL